MNKSDFVRYVTETLKQNDVRKKVTIPKHKFYISDEEGHTREFSVTESDKNILFTVSDIESILDTILDGIIEVVRCGDSLRFTGFGTFGVKYRQPRLTKNVGTGETVYVEGRYVPKFSFGQDFRRGAKMYNDAAGDDDEESDSIAETIAEVEEDSSDGNS